MTEYIVRDDKLLGLTDEMVEQKLIRCKDCRFFSPIWTFDEGGCKKHSELGTKLPSCWYCGDGKPKED